METAGDDLLLHSRKALFDVCGFNPSKMVARRVPEMSANVELLWRFPLSVFDV